MPTWPSFFKLPRPQFLASMKKAYGASSFYVEKKGKFLYFDFFRPSLTYFFKKTFAYFRYFFFFLIYGKILWDVLLVDWYRQLHIFTVDSEMWVYRLAECKNVDRKDAYCDYTYRFIEFFMHIFLCGCVCAKQCFQLV